MKQVTQKQVEKILKENINISGIAKEFLAKGFGKQIKVIIPGKNTPRFIDNKNGTITDTKTGLIWVKNPHTDLPEEFKNYMPWKQAIEACKRLNYAGHKDWRLPTVEELRELVDYTRGAKSGEPAIDTAIFPDTKCNWYWTITEVAWDADGAWVVNFSYGSVGDCSKASGSCVRPVRSSK
jgi:hypothetical protein